MLGGATFSGLGRGQVFASSTTGAASLISALVLPSLTCFHNSAGSTVGFCTCSGCVSAGTILTASEIWTILGGATFSGLDRGQVFAPSTTGAESLVVPLPTIKTSTARLTTLDNNEWADFLSIGLGAL